MQNLKRNVKAGLTTSLVSIPLSVSLAVASKTTPTVGIITVVWAGLIASVFGGSTHNIIGPTGALAGLLAVFAMQNGMESMAMLAIVSLLLIRYFKFMPLAVIAAILVNTAINMVEKEHFERFFRTDKVSFILAILVAFITIYEDPIVGILFGINGYKNVILRLRGVHFVDMDGVDAFDEILEVIRNKGGIVYITGVNKLIEDMLMESDDYVELKKSGHVFPSTGDALTSLGFELESVK